MPPSLEFADVVVVGAGVMGASIAFHLAKRQAGRIVVLEKNHAGQGASGRSSALVRMHYTFPPEVVLAVKSLEVYKHWDQLVGERSGYRQTGFVRIVPASETERLKKNVEMQRKCGSKVQVISVDDMRKIEPDWILDDQLAIAFEPEGGYWDGSVVANDFIAAARNMGVNYQPRTRVIQLIVDGDRIQGVRTDKGEIAAQTVVLAIGQWTRPLLLGIGIDLPIKTDLHYVAILRNAPDMSAGSCACIDSTITTYFRSEGKDKTLIGDFYGEGEVDPETFATHVPHDWFERIVEKASRRVPKLRHSEIMKGITGVYDMSPDSRPILGAVDQIEGLYVAAGFSGMGFKLAPAIGLLISELVLDGTSGVVDVTPFLPKRFAIGEPIRAEYEYQDD